MNVRVPPYSGKSDDVIFAVCVGEEVNDVMAVTRVEVVVDDELQENNKNAMIKRQDNDNRTLFAIISLFPPLPI